MKFTLVPNVACTSNVLSIGVSPSLGIAAAVWTATQAGLIASVRLNCLKHAIRILLEHYPSWELWLVASHRVAQPDNRITRHFGLWKSLQKRGVRIPSGDFLRESSIASESGMRYFGAVCFASDQLEAVCDVLSSESAAIFACDSVSARSIAERLVESGWSQHNTAPPEEILERVCSEGGVVVNVFGEFDDVEIAAAVMGKAELVARLSDSRQL